MAVAHKPELLKRQRPTRRARRRPSHWKLKLILTGALAAVVLPAAAYLARVAAPTTNTSRTRFDAIVVLGTPADEDGNPTPEMLARVTEGVREYERGVAPRLVFSGGGVFNQAIEGEIMARTARAMGIPASAIFTEIRAHDTIQNARFSERILMDHGWNSLEVVSTDWHLPRAGYIFNRLPLEWSVHAAPPVAEESAAHLRWAVAVETIKTLRYFLWARWVEPSQP